jgi:DNA-binding GntR family transcriptional regulator
LKLCRRRDAVAACELLARHIRTAGKSLSQIVTEHRQKQEENAVVTAASRAAI